jgi:Zn-dependent metalloprotease
MIMRKIFRYTSLAILTGVLAMSQSLTAQSSKSVKKLKTDARVQEVSYDQNRGTPKLITFKDVNNLVSKQQIVPYLTAALSLDNSSTTLVIGEKGHKNTTNIETIKLQQFFKGIKVEHGIYSAILKEEKVKGIVGEFYNIDEAVSPMPAINDATALQRALTSVGASEYAWDYVSSLASQSVNLDEIQAINELYDTYFPTGELVYVDDYTTSEVVMRLAYKFNVYAAQPLSRGYVYVDATDGKILLYDAIIKHANEKTFAEIETIVVTGSGDTRYAGTRNFDTTLDIISGEYSLIGVAVNGIENETRSLEGVGGIPLSSPALYANSVAIVDTDNNWTNAEHMPDDFSLPYPVHNEFNNDDIALDAHWGAEVVLQYWFNKHGRSSYDGLGTKVFNFVHYGDAYDNAFWNGTSMTYGDGSSQQGTGGGFHPLTSMDVCAHEIGHGICEYTSNLVYQRESGAMNEGFSDIWGAAVENYVLTEIDGTLPYQPFGIGEQIDDRDGGVDPGSAASQALRWMDDPKAEGNPDSYGGDNWSEPECGEPTLANDQCGVHNNSGVLNKWYYFLVKGSGLSFSPGAGKAAADDGVSDGGSVYNVVGLGYEKADQIAFLGETMLSPNSKFEDMRNASIMAAQTLYGIEEVEQVTNAWYAVDIGDEFDPGTPNVITLNSTNPLLASENTQMEGCNAAKVLNYGITAVLLAAPATVTLDLSGTTAVEGEDFDISQTVFSFPSGSSDASYTLTIYNDAVVEMDETIHMKIVYAGHTDTQILTIADNDIVPLIGNMEVDLLALEEFTVSDQPAGWEVRSQLDATSPTIWSFNGAGAAQGVAYVDIGTGTSPSYDTNNDAHVLLITPMVNAIGHKNVTVSFDWTAGGERDATDGTYFDYGEFIYSYDGTNFTSVQKYAGDSGGTTITNGVYNVVMPALDNTQFVLAWRWFNDALLGSAYSFTVDNVLVKGTPATVETELGNNTSNKVNQNSDVYFVSDQSGDVLARIDGNSVSLGCVNVAVIEAGSTSFVAMTNLDVLRATKVIQVSPSGPDAATATYNITLYYKNTELQEVSEIEEVSILKVDGSNVDLASDVAENYVISGGLLEDNVTGEYKTFSGIFTGFSSFTIIAPLASLANSSNLLSNLVLSPNPTNGMLRISSPNAFISEISITDIQGRIINTMDVNDTNTHQIDMSVLRSAIYFVTIKTNEGSITKRVIRE